MLLRHLDAQPRPPELRLPPRRRRLRPPARHHRPQLRRHLQRGQDDPQVSHGKETRLRQAGHDRRSNRNRRDRGRGHKPRRRDSRHWGQLDVLPVDRGLLREHLRGQPDRGPAHREEQEASGAGDLVSGGSGSGTASVRKAVRKRRQTRQQVGSVRRGIPPENVGGEEMLDRDLSKTFFFAFN